MFLQGRTESPILRRFHEIFFPFFYDSKMLSRLFEHFTNFRGKVILPAQRIVKTETFPIFESGGNKCPGRNVKIRKSMIMAKTFCTKIIQMFPIKCLSLKIQIIRFYSGRTNREPPHLTRQVTLNRTGEIGFKMPVKKIQVTSDRRIPRSHSASGSPKRRRHRTILEKRRL